MPVTAPERRGFGTRLIQTALAGEFDGEIDLSYPETGVRFSLDADAHRVLAPPDPANALPAA
jgi:two-component sensor histidine kinase